MASANGVSQAQANILLHLMNSGEFSDLTLDCQGEVFNVHKAVVCAQLPTLKAAIDGAPKVRGFLFLVASSPPPHRRRSRIDRVVY